MVKCISDIYAWSIFSGLIVDQTHPVLASGYQVLQKIIVQNWAITKLNNQSMTNEAIIFEGFHKWLNLTSDFWKLTVKYFLAKILWTLLDSFLHFFGWTYVNSQVLRKQLLKTEQNLLPRRKKGESFNKSSEQFHQEEFYS